MKLRHIGIVSENPGKLLYFYKGLLGDYEILSAQAEQGDFIKRLYNLPYDDDVIINTLKVKFFDKREEFVLEFVHYVLPSCTDWEKSIYRTGLTHLAFTVDNLANSMANVRNYGGKIFTKNTDGTNEEGTAKVCFCKDPEGNFIELVEELDEKAS